jgi:hypothetical protein
VTTLYWLALVLGGGLGLLSLIGGSIEMHVDHEVADPDAWHILSMRSVTYFLFAFGAVGLLTRAAGSGPTLSLAAAAFTGGVSLFASAALFRYLNRTSSGAVPTDASLVGLMGAVVLPLRRDGGGKIVVYRAGREIELMARPFGDDASDSEAWNQVVVVEVSGGTALVAPYPDLHHLPSATE